MKFVSPEVVLYCYKSTVQPCMEYYCHVWTGAPSYFLEMLDKLQKWICRIFGPLLAVCISLASHKYVASSILFYRYFVGRFSSELTQLVPFPYS